MCIEGVVVVLKGLKMGQIAGPRPVIDRAHQPWAAGRAPHAAGRLDILGGGFGLPSHHHQPQPFDIDSHGDHIGGQNHIVRGREFDLLPRFSIRLALGFLSFVEDNFQALQDLGK